MADTAKSADVARRLALTEARAVEAERQAAAKDAMLIEKERELVRVAGVRTFVCVCVLVCLCEGLSVCVVCGVWCVSV